MGPSQIYETQFSGVWRITHFNAANEVVGRYVEVTRIPEILLAQEADVRVGLDLLTRRLSGESEQEDRAHSPESSSGPQTGAGSEAGG